MLQRWFGPLESAIFIAIFCTMPGVIVLSTIANADIPELLYVAGSLAFYFAACESASPRRLLLCAGVCAGIAFATRETSAGLIAAYGLLFLFRPVVNRFNYLLIAAGFAIVIALEMGYFAWETGNPLWRFTFDVHHDVVDRAAVLGTGQVIDREGNLAIGGEIGKFVSPLFIFFVTQKYGLLFYLMLATLPAIVHRSWSANRKTFLIVAAALFVAWACFIIFNAGLLYLVPRYFVVTAWVATIVSAIGLARMWKERPRLAASLFAVTLATNGICLYVENTDPNQPSRAAIEVAKQSRETVYTDPVTLRRGRFIAQIDGVADRIAAGAPHRGALYVFSSDNMPPCRKEHCGITAADILAVKRGQEIAQIVPPPRAIGRMLDALRLTPLIPPQIRKKLIRPNSGVIVYRSR
jgi:hypothetical protein